MGFLVSRFYVLLGCWLACAITPASVYCADVSRASAKIAAHRQKQQAQSETAYAHLESSLSALDQRSLGKASGSVDLGLYTTDRKAFNASLRRVRPDIRKQILDFYRDMEDFNAQASSLHAKELAQSMLPEQRARVERSAFALDPSKANSKPVKLNIPPGKLKQLPEHVKRKGEGRQ